MLIVYYHNVVNGPLDEFDRKLSRIDVDEFARQMRRLAEEFRPVSLEAMLSMMADGESDPKAVAVTFDDGYYGVVRHALPVMSEFGIPATIFVVTDYVRENEDIRLMHFDELEVCFRLSPAATLDLDFMGERPVRLSSAHARVDAMKRLKKRMKSAPEAERRRLHGEILERLGVSPEQAAAYAASEEKFRTAAWDELRESRGAGLSVGSHTCSHRVLSRLERGDLEDELLCSFSRLREELGAGDPLPFAYPYGSEDSIGVEAPALARQAGYSCGLTTVQGRNTPALDPFLLRRVEFEALDWPW